MITQEQKEEMLVLREEGWSFPEIAKRYGIDHTTVMYHLRNPQKKVQRRSFRGKRYAEVDPKVEHIQRLGASMEGLLDEVDEMFEREIFERRERIKEAKTNND